MRCIHTLRFDDLSKITFTIGYFCCVFLARASLCEYIFGTQLDVVNFQDYPPVNQKIVQNKKQSTNRSANNEIANSKRPVTNNSIKTKSPSETNGTATNNRIPPIT